MLPRLLALLLLALLVTPSASAFATERQSLDLAYAFQDTPILLGAGAVSGEGDFRSGLLFVNVSPLRLSNAGLLQVVEKDEQGRPSMASFEDATLVLHSGSLLWPLKDGLNASFHVPYGFLLGTPDAPVPSESGSGSPGPGFLAVGSNVSAQGQWRGESTSLVVLDARVSILDASGNPVEGWDRRAINDGFAPGEAPDPSQLDALFQLEERATLEATATLVGGAAGAGALGVQVTRGEEDRFVETLAALSDLGRLLGGVDEGPFQQDNPLEAFAGLSGILNGGVLVLSGAPGGGEDAQPIRAQVGGEPFEVGRMALLRSDEPLRVGWQDDEMSIQGDTTVALGQQGFAIEPPNAIGGAVPLLSLVLWLVALGAIVHFVVRRPPKAKTPIPYRLAAWGAHLATFLVVFWLWDRSFAKTFGTSFLTELSSGVAGEEMMQLFLLLGFQMFPWGLAALFFALPVRIAVAIALRYLGKGKGLKGFAGAAGLVALGALGPVYALWLANVLIQRALQYAPF